MLSELNVELYFLNRYKILRSLVKCEELTMMLENKLKLQLVFLTLVSAYSEIKYYDAVEMRWDFSSCGKTGRYGPSQVGFYS